MLVVHTGNASRHVPSFCLVSHPRWPPCRIPEALGPALLRGAAGCVSPVSQRVRGRSHRSPRVSPNHIKSQDVFSAVSRPVWTGWSLMLGGRRRHRRFNLLFQGSPSAFEPLGSRAVEGICFLIRLRFKGESVKDGVWGFVLQMLFHGKGSTYIACMQKGVCRINRLVQKTMRNKVPSHAEINFKGKTHLLFFHVSTHLFSSSSFVKKSKIFNN